MLFVLFQLDDDRYAISASKVVEILPLLDLKKIPQAPEGIAGVLDYRGSVVPVADLSLLALKRPAARHLSTRILIVRIDAGFNLGLIAERANETFKRDPSEFVESGVAVDGAEYLGPVARDSRGLVQWISPEKLLSPAVRDSLVRQLSQAA